MVCCMFHSFLYLTIQCLIKRNRCFRAIMLNYINWCKQRLDKICERLLPKRKKLMGSNFVYSPSHSATEIPLYMHLDVSCRVPPPQVTEQDEATLQDDQAGHDWVLHVSFLTRFED